LFNFDSLFIGMIDVLEQLGVPESDRKAVVAKLDVLNVKQAKFVAHYVSTGKKMASALAAGYREGAASTKLMKNPKVTDAINLLKASITGAIIAPFARIALELVEEYDKDHSGKGNKFIQVETISTPTGKTIKEKTPDKMKVIKAIIELAKETSTDQKHDEITVILPKV